MRSKTVSRRYLLVAGAAIVALAAFVRLFHHSTNYDVFIDEVTYAHIARNLADGRGVSLFGQNFYLHPPAYFYVAAAFLKVFGQPHELLTTVLRLRTLNSAIGAINVALIMVLVGRVAGRTWGLLAGLLAALDPFIVLWDSRVLLESMAMGTALIGWCLLTLVAGPEGQDLRAGSGASAPLRRTVGISALAGLFFGLSLLTKETYAFVGIVPIVAAAAFGRPFRRAVSVTAAVAAIACYVAYWLTLVVNHDLPTWWSQESAGLQRATGAKQISGFNQAGHASFTSRILADLNLYLGPYIVILLISIALLLEVRLLWIRYRCKKASDAGEIMVTLLALGGAVYAAYAVGFGAFEEQVFYLFEVSGLPLLAMSAKRVLDSEWRLSTRTRHRVLGFLCLVVVGYGVAIDAYVRSTRDTALSELQSYVATHLARRAVVDPTDGVSEYLLGTRIIVLETSVAGLRSSTVRYVVYNRSLTQQGYVHLSKGFVPFLHRAGRVIFRVSDRSNGTVLLYKLRRPADELTASGQPIKR